MRTSFSSEDAPKRNRSGVIQLRPERLVERHEVLDRLLRCADPARGLDADDVPRLVVHVANDLHHAERHRQRRRRAHLPGRGLDEVRAGGNRDQRGTADVVVRSELARLEDHLEVRLTARFLHADDLVENLRVPTGEECAAIDDHVDLVGAEIDDGSRFRNLDLRRRLAGGKRRRDGRDLHAAAREPLLRDSHEARVDAHRRHRRNREIGGVGPHRLRAERGHLAWRVLPLERRQIHHPDRELECLHLRLALDRPLRERRGALLERDRVDRADTRKPRAGRELEATDECWR